MFSDETAVRTFAQEHKTTMQKLAQWFDEFIQTLKETVQNLSGRLPEAAKIPEKTSIFWNKSATRHTHALEEDGRGSTQAASRREKFSIQTLPDGKRYVRADEQVIKSENSVGWGAKSSIM